MSYRLRHNGDCWVIQTRRVRGENAKNAGEVYWAENKYYPKLRQAATKLLDLYVAEDSDGAEEIASLISRINVAEHNVIAHINQVTGE